MAKKRQTILAHRFKLEELIGHGGMGEVYRALDNQTGEPVAVKRLRSELIKEVPTLVQRFAREGQALRQLNHPNIVKMLATLTEENEHYLVMEYVGGGSLADLLKKEGPLPVAQAVKIGLDLADALTHAHHLNIIHRDFKPANILLTVEGEPRLTDFGTARLQYVTQLTGTGMIVGTSTYMSPEACNGDILDARTDIWSFGVTLFEMLTGRPPFTNPRLVTLLMDIMTEPPPDLQQLRPEVTDALADLVYRMLAKDRDQRIPSTRLVGLELEAVAQGGRAEGRTSESRTHASARFARLTEEKAMPSHNLPLVSTPFVGREEELAEIERLLLNVSCRLLTLHGPGGIGKTRLALQAGLNYLERFRAGVYFVDLSTVEVGAFIVPAIADAIQFNFFGGEEPETQLLNYLQNKEMLLVLDNFEHLVGSAELLARILRAAPQVQIMVTSQERLNLREEWVLTLTGLPVPEEVSVQSLSEATAVQLFWQSARRVRPNFAPTSQDLPAIQHICQLVDGLPLGIELAAAWTNALTPQEIGNQISKNFDFLVTNLRDLPLRHRSVRSVFEYAWELLTRKERQALSRLSVFRGGFDRPAATKVAKASLLSLNTLMDKSLLRREPASGRYGMQELLRQFAAEKLGEMNGAVASVSRQHAYYYLSYLNRYTNDLTGWRQTQALSYIHQEIGNVRAAWQWAVAAGDRQALSLGLDALYYYYQLRGRQRQGVDAFAQAARALRDQSKEPDIVLAKVVARQGAFSRFIGRLDEAALLLQESLKLARTLQNKREIAFSLYHLGAADPSSPNAQQYWQESLSLAREVDDRSLMAEILNWLAFTPYQQGDFNTAVRLLEKSLTLRRTLSDKYGLAAALTNLGVIQIRLGNYEKARNLLQEGLQLSQALNNLHGMAVACNNLSFVAINTQDYDAAQEWGEQGLAYFREVGDRRAEGFALVNLSEIALYQHNYTRAQEFCRKSIKLYERLGLSAGMGYNMAGRIALAQDNYEEARQAFRQALQEEPDPSMSLEILTGIAALMVYTGNKGLAFALLTFIRQHSASEQLVRARAAAQLAALEKTLSAKQITAARSQTRYNTIEEWIKVAQRQVAGHQDGS